MAAVATVALANVVAVRYVAAAVDFVGVGVVVVGAAETPHSPLLLLLLLFVVVVGGGDIAHH